MIFIRDNRVRDFISRAAKTVFLTSTRVRGRYFNYYTKIDRVSISRIQVPRYRQDFAKFFPENRRSPRINRQNGNRLALERQQRAAAAVWYGLLTSTRRKVTTYGKGLGINAALYEKERGRRREGERERERNIRNAEKLSPFLPPSSGGPVKQPPS